MAQVKHPTHWKGITNLPQELSRYVLEGYSAIDTTSGDLNLDPYPDMIMVLRKDGEDTTSDAKTHFEKRPLLILVNNGQGGYDLGGVSYNTVLCIDCGGTRTDPFKGITIKNGEFTVLHQWSSLLVTDFDITYRYSSLEKYWYLNIIETTTYRAGEKERTTEFNLKTTRDFGIVLFNAYDIYSAQ
jgi:hypothetical protein